MVGLVKKLVTQDYFRIYEDEEISHMASLLEKGARAVLVFGRNEKYKGIISKKHLLKNFPFNIKTKISTLSTIKNQASVNDDIYTVAKTMLEAELKQIPLFSGGTLMGVIDVKSIIEKLGKELHDSSVDKCMTTSILHLDAHDQLSAAFDVFKKKWISRMPVMEGEQTLGIVTLTDALLEVLIHGPNALTMPVDKLMQTKLVSIKRTDNISAAIDLMALKNVSSVLVFEKDSLYGIITEKDILERIISASNLKAETYYIQASGELEKLTSSEKSAMNDDLVSFIERYSNKFQEACVHLYIKEVSEKFREKKKFSIRINLTTDRGRFYSSEEDFGVQQALHLALRQLEVQIEKKFGKEKTKTTRNKPIKKIR